MFLSHHFIEAADIMIFDDLHVAKPHGQLLIYMLLNLLAAFNTVHHSFLKYLILLASRDPSLLVLCPPDWSLVHFPSL